MAYVEAIRSRDSIARRSGGSCAHMLIVPYSLMCQLHVLSQENCSTLHIGSNSAVA